VGTTATDLGVTEIGAEHTAEQLDGLLAVQQVLEAELDPDDPPVPAQELRADLFQPAPRHRKRVWLATVGREPVGSAVTDQVLDGVNDAAELAVLVRREWRRRGIGSAIARAALPTIAEAGASSVIGWPWWPDAAAFCELLGMTDRQVERCSRLRLADLDPEQQRRWRDEAPARSAGYRLVGWAGVCPDERADALADALASMVDAPMDEVDFAPQPLLGREVQERERAWDDAGYDTVTTLALAPDGSAAGASQLLVSRLRPTVAEQGDTGVVAAHRGHSLGRWLKSENLRRAVEHQPGVEVVQTYNAESNPYMLAINVDMGFGPYHSFTTWQGSVANALAALGT
jgi:mycothiol synthase